MFRSGKTQKQKPRAFHENRVEELNFDHITLDDGTVISTYKDSKNGEYMYMDWDDGKWKPVKEEWKELLSKAANEYNTHLGNFVDEDKEVVETDDPRLGSFEHPSKGNFSTYFFANERNTRLFFDDGSGSWVRMPLAWERGIEDVKNMLNEIDAVLPAWKNCNEQLLVLRDCNYDIAEAISFAEINFGYSTQDQSQRPTTPAAVNRFVKRHSMHHSAFNDNSEAVHEPDELLNEKLSAPVAKKIDALTHENTKLKQELEEMKNKQLPQITEQMKAMQRQNTNIAKESLRRKSVVVNAEDRLANLSDKLKDQREEIAALEADLVQTKAELETAKVTGGGGGDGSRANSDVESELKDNRLKLLEANLTIAELKKEADKFDGAALLHMKQEIEAIKEIKDELTSTNTDFMEMEISFGQCKTLVQRMSKGVGAEVDELRKKYRAEVIQRKQLYNKIQEMRGNIRVFTRCRKDKRVKCVHKFPSKSEIVLPKLTGEPVTVDFDAVYGPDSKQEELFVDAKPVIMSVVDGYNVCIMAYGQTGSGKTYTMMGPVEDPGVNRRAIQELLTLIESAGGALHVELQVSMMEVYNENVFDLLHPSGRVKCDVRSGPSGAYAAGMTQRPILNAQEAEQTMADGQEHRSLAATAMNSESSRSHLIFQIAVDTVNTTTKIRTSAKLTLVDLAGSERIAKSEVTGSQLVEAAAINKSLSALGQVFQAISKSSPHVPFRNSKLTHVLQDSLGGDSKTCMFINIR